MVPARLRQVMASRAKRVLLQPSHSSSLPATAAWPDSPQVPLLPQCPSSSCPKWWPGRADPAGFCSSSSRIPKGLGHSWGSGATCR